MIYTNGARRVNLRHEAYDVDCTRHGKWGNPFQIGPDGSREHVIDLHRRWLKLQPELIAALPELRGRILGCVCEAGQHCHADTLLRLANKGVAVVIKLHRRKM